MSTPVQTSMAGLKGSTLKLVGIIAGARLIPAGTGEAHNVLTKQATTLLGEIVWEHEKGDYIPGIVASCSKELLRVCPMTPRVWPNWHSIGHDDPRVSKHTWRNKICAWEVLGDHSCDLSVVPDPSTSPLTVDLPSPAPVPPPAPVIPSTPVLPSPPGISSTSGPQTSEFQDKGKGKAVAVNLAPEVEGSRKRKSPMISGHSSQPPKSAMKSCKRAKSAPDVELEDEEDTNLQPISRGVPEVVLPQLSTIVVRTPQLPRLPGSPKKQNFGPASQTSGSRPEVVKPTDDTAGASDGEPPAIPPIDITVPGPVSTALNSLSSVHSWIPQNNPCYYCVKEDWHCETRVDRRTGHPCLSCLWCATKKIKCHPVFVGSPPKRTCSRTPAPAPSTGPVCLAVQDPDSKSISCPCCDYTQDHCQEDACPCPCPCHSCATVPRTALDVSMPDLHSMAIAIRDGAACIAILEACVREQDGKIDTLQRLHESLRCQVVDRHPSFPLPDSPANATMLLDQSVPPPSMSPLPSALPNLINLDMEVMEPTPLKVEDASDMVGLVFEPSQVQPEGPQSSGEIVIPDDPGNLFPDYNSVSEEMDVEVKAGTSDEEVEMAA
ncbi:hypothetical protein EDD22DRAFT_897941 [Suillus occidentalis]|nr:hypothetical protein EDD22DRAFT_897941 [Suillus occidentalis]